MKYVLPIIAFLSCQTTLAESFTARFHSKEKNLLKFENGRVAFIDEASPKIRKGDLVKVFVDENSTLRTFEMLSRGSEVLQEKSFFEQGTRPLYHPTVVPDMAEAWKIFKRSNPDYKRISECTDRAHVWAHDELKFSGIKSLKAFVFFTASYINSVRFKWWFHVAPMYKVRNKGELQDIVMDYRYTDRPMTVKEWTDHFVYTKRPCKVTTKFSEYDVNPQTENCYLIIESMHYKIPGEIHEQELSGKYKTETTDFELKSSFRFGFQQ